VSDQVVDWIGPFIDRIRLLGQRTAELHLELVGRPEDPLVIQRREPYERSQRIAIAEP